MQPNGTIDINDTLKAWADIVIEKWQVKIIELGVFDTEALYDSLLAHCVRESGQNIDRIDFSFKLYGIFVDMGAGRYGEGRFHQKNTNWFSRIFFWQIRRLREILLERYSSMVSDTVINQLTIGFFDLYDSSKSVYTPAQRQGIRNAKNYYRRRAKPGRWTNNWKTWKSD